VCCVLHVLGVFKSLCDMFSTIVCTLDLLTSDSSSRTYIHDSGLLAPPGCSAEACELSCIAYASALAVMLNLHSAPSCPHRAAQTPPVRVRSPLVVAGARCVYRAVHNCSIMWGFHSRFSVHLAGRFAAIADSPCRGIPSAQRRWGLHGACKTSLLASCSVYADVCGFPCADRPAYACLAGGDTGGHSHTSSNHTSSVHKCVPGGQHQQHGRGAATNPCWGCHR
jgi:hypothetical protein